MSSQTCAPTASDPLCQRFAPMVLVLARDLETGRIDLRDTGRVERFDGPDRGSMIVGERRGTIYIARFRIVTWDQGERAVRGLPVCEVIDQHGAPRRLLAYAHERLSRSAGSR